MSFIRKIKKGNYTYLAEVENVWENGKVKQKHIRYVGKEIDGERKLSGSIERAKIDKVSIYGPLLIIDSIAKEFGLSDLLGKNGEYLLSLTYGHCVEPNSVKKLTDWFERTDIHSLLKIPDVTYKKLLESLEGFDGEYGHFVQEKIFKKIQEYLNLEQEGYFYDVTNAYFYGLKCSMAKKKKTPKSLNLPQIEIGLAVTKEYGIPIFHKVFDGNIHDSKTLPDILLMFNEHKIKDATIVWDRGVSSENNIKEACRVGFNIICGLALSNKIKVITEDTVSKSDFNSIKNRVRLRNATFYVKKIFYRYGETKGYLHICLNEKEKQDIKERRYDELNRAISLLSNNKEIKEGLKKYLRGKYFNYSELEKAEKFDGISAIFSTENLLSKQVVTAYFEKDRVEKAFRTLKGLLEMDKIRFWLKDKVKAHIFICYLSYLLMSLLDYKLRDTEFNSAHALEIMESMYKVQITDPKSKNIFSKTVTLTKKQEIILKSVDKKLIKS